MVRPFTGTRVDKDGRGRQPATRNGRGTMKRIFGMLLGAVLLLTAVLVIRTLQFAPPQFEASETLADVDWSEAELAAGLAGALRFPTISNIDADAVDQQAFEDFQAYLKQRFPRVFAQIPHQRLPGGTLLFRWSGNSEALKPIMLIAHQDVVPVIPGTEDQWSYPPFAGTIADGYIWGRGAIDDKASVIGILEATERLLEEGFVPPRTVYLGFGHDEEVGGKGAQAMAALLAERGESLAFLLDEGGVIAKDMLPGVAERVALIGPAEKGYVSLKLSADGGGGHSSMPPQQSAAGVVAAAVARLEANPLPADMQYTVDFIRYLGDSVPFYQRLLFANNWLFEPLLEKVLSSQAPINAGMRTTTAVTMLQGSVRDNVLPIIAYAVVNFRILPGDTIEGVQQKVAEIIDDPRIRIETYGGFGNNPSAVASPDSAGFNVLADLVRQVSPGTLVAPRLVVAATDARHFEEVSENSYRFIGVEVGPKEMKGIHGTDERVSIASYVEAVRIYYHLLRRSAEL